MDPYLDSLSEMRREAMSSLKSALGHVGSIVALVNSLNDQIVAENARRTGSSAAGVSPPSVAVAPTSGNVAEPVAGPPAVTAQEFSAASSSSAPRDSKTAWSRAEPDTTLKEPLLTVARREIIYNIKDEPVDHEDLSGADPLDLTAPKSPQETDRPQPVSAAVASVPEPMPPPLQPTVRLEQLPAVAGGRKKPAPRRRKVVGARRRRPLGEGLSEEQRREASKRWLREQREQLEGRVLRMRRARNYFPEEGHEGTRSEEESVKSERRRDDE